MQRANVDFDAPWQFVDSSASIATQGFVFTPISGSILITDYYNLTYNGSNVLFPQNNTPLTTQPEIGGTFSLLSLDLGGSHHDAPNRWASAVAITGYDAANNVVASTSVDLPADLNDFLRVQLSDFTNLARVTFVPSMNLTDHQENNYEFTLDNIHVTLVPEPQSCAILLASLGFVGFFGHRKKTATS